MRRLGFLIFWPGLMLFVLSFAGSLHPVGDSIAVFRYWIALAVVFAVVLISRGWRKVIAMAGLGVGLFLDPLLSSSANATTASGAGRYALYQKNVLHNNWWLPHLEMEIREAAPDFITLQELSHENEPIYHRLRDEFGSAVFCSGGGINWIAAMSRFPRTGAPTICDPINGLAAIQVETPDGPVWLAAVHMRWPWPKAQPQNLAAILPVLEGLEKPVLVAGDFNAVPWSNAMARIARASGSRRLGPIQRTLFGSDPLVRHLRLPIDHVLVPGGQGTVETRPALGSDHLGLLARFDL